jgi:hypothetical protein
LKRLCQPLNSGLDESKERKDVSMSTENTYMDQPEVTKASTSCASRKQRRLLPWLPNNGVLLMAAVAAIGGGFVLNWGWLVAVGLAPLILSVLPCIAMCALGVCICKLAGNRATNPKPQLDDSIAEKAADPTDTTIVGERNTA